MDTTGLLLAIAVHAANIQDRDGAKLVLVKLLHRFPRLQVIWADGAYAGRLVAWAWATGGWVLSVVRRNPDSHRFEVLPRRWVISIAHVRIRRTPRILAKHTGPMWTTPAFPHVLGCGKGLWLPAAARKTGVGLCSHPYFS